MKRQLLLLIATGLLLIGCKSGTGSGAEPVIDSITPLKGPPGVAVTIKGSGFNPQPDKNRIEFNGRRAVVDSVSSEYIIAFVPENATTGIVEVTVGGETASGSVFFVDPGLPGIRSLEPQSAKFGEKVTVTGYNFSSDPQQNEVSLNGQDVPVESAGETELVIRIPKGVGSGSLRLTVGEQTINGLDFTYIPTVTVKAWAGSIEGSLDGDSTEARFSSPAGIVANNDGSLYVVDQANHRIRFISPSREVTTYAGSSRGFRSGSATEARFYDPLDISVGDDGNLYVTDTYNNSIRVVSRDVNQGIIVTTLAGNGDSGDQDGSRGTVRMHHPAGIAAHPSGDLYVTDYINHKVKRVETDGKVTSVAGDGAYGYRDGDRPRFNSPFYLTADRRGIIYISDYINSLVRTYDPGADVAGTLAGKGSFGYKDGPAEEALFNRPAGIVRTSDGIIYVADSFNHCIRRISRDGIVTTIAGNGTAGEEDGPGEQARFNRPTGLALGPDGSLYVSDSKNHRIRKITIE